MQGEGSSCANQGNIARGRAQQSTQHTAVSADAYFEPALQHSDHPLEQLEWFYRALYKLAQKAVDQSGFYPGCPFINIAMELATANPTVREAVQDVFEDQVWFYGQIVQNAIAQNLCASDLDQEQVVKGLMATMSGALVMAKVQNSSDEILAMLPVAQKLLS